MSWQDVILNDETLREYVVLEETIRPMLKRMGDIRDACKMRGSFYTAEFVITVKDQSFRRLVGLKEVEEALGKSILEKNNLIRLSIAQIVHISKQGRKDDRRENVLQTAGNSD